MPLDDSVSAQTYEYFLQEATELLQTMDEELQDLTESFSVQKGHNLMRAAHTLKGAAASVGLDSIKEATHSIEDVFKALCHQDTVITVEMEGLIFAAYDCLKLLMSAQLAEAQIDEADITDRMMGVVTQLQELLGDRFGQDGHLPTSAELGFDMTQSIFEVGVMQRLDLFETALASPNTEELLDLMQAQAEVFIGLAESLDLPGFAAIAQTTQAALGQNPHSILEIAPIALANYRAAQVEVLGGDRTLGGTPSSELKQFTQPVIQPSPTGQIEQDDYSTLTASGFIELAFTESDLTEPEFDLTSVDFIGAEFTEQIDLTRPEEDQLEVVQRIEKQPETSVENNWLLRLLKPPTCPDLEESESAEPALVELVPEQLALLDLPENQTEATFSEAIAFLETADFDNQVELCELIPDGLDEVNLPSDKESPDVASPHKELLYEELSGTEPLDINLSDISITTNAFSEIEPLEESQSENNSLIDEEPTEIESLEPKVLRAEVPKIDYAAPGEWLSFALPTPNLSTPEKTNSSLLDVESSNSEPPDIKLSDITLSDIEPSDIEPSDIELPEFALPDNGFSHVDFFATESPEVTIGGSVETTQALPDLSLVFKLEDHPSPNLSLKPTSATLAKNKPLLSAIKSEESTPKKTDSVAVANKSPNAQATLRIAVENLDQLTQSMGKLLTQQNKQSLYNEQLTLLVRQLLEKVDRQQKQLDLPQYKLDEKTIVQSSPIDLNSISPSSLAQFDALELDQYSDSQRLTQVFSEAAAQQIESAESIELFVRRSSQTLSKQKKLLTRMRETLLDVRMLPLDKVFQRFPSAIKRLEAQYPKQVQLAMIGGDVLVDRVIADKLYDPLLHLLRNAFDHGIETAQQRSLTDKPATGSITIEASQQGRYLVIQVKDDGQGLDLDKICRKAIDSSLITDSEAAGLTPEQTTDLLFEPGFSTASEINHLSGRGVGLDAVKAQMRSLQGQVTVSQQPNAGTCFTLRIPSSLTIAKLMLCESQNRTYALIADAIEHILIPSPQQVRSWEGGKAIAWQADGKEHLVPVSALADVLHYASPAPPHQLEATQRQVKAAIANPVILIRCNNTLIGIEVDQLRGEQELAINALDATLTPPAYLYGSSILPNGQLTLVLDSIAIAKLALEQKKAPIKKAPIRFKPSETTQSKPSSQRSISNTSQHPKLALTIDDSITVRNSLAEALQKSGYQVIQAKDGEEGLQQLRSYPNVDVILCDLEMPGMNGFEFLKARQRAPEIASIPTIMLTSRDGNKHRLLAKELGAIAYLTKPFLAAQVVKTVATAIAAVTPRPISTSGEFQ